MPLHTLIVMTKFLVILVQHYLNAFTLQVVQVKQAGWNTVKGPSLGATTATLQAEYWCVPGKNI